MAEQKFEISRLLDLSHTMAAGMLANCDNPWSGLTQIRAYVKALGDTLPHDEYDMVAPDVWVHKTARVAPTASLAGPCIIGPNTEVRHCAFIRGSVLVGENCVVGNSVELKTCILFDEVHVPHFNYVGDSVLGYKAHMGAGSITSNVRSDRALVRVHRGDEIMETNLKKFGAIIGDGVEIGCNAVLNPGTIIGKNCIIYPLSNVRGVVFHDSIYKANGEIVPRAQDGQ